MLISQRTIKNEVTLKGVGIHTGCNVEIRLIPAEVDAGIQFVRVDLKDRPAIKADPKSVSGSNDHVRRTILGKDECGIQTIEHFMSALFGYGITNLIVEINANELPGMDGSASLFVEMLEKAGVLEQDKEQDVYSIMEAIGVVSGDSSIYVVPSDEFKISYALNYEDSFLGSQFFSRSIDKDVYLKEIASCRTFCLESEAAILKKNGFGKGASYENTLIVGEAGVKNNKLRFPDEFVRHKVLDLIGDLYLLGFPLKGHFFAVKSGHNLNIQMMKKIAEQKEKYKKVYKPFTIEEGKNTIDVQEICKILPHRYPFLLVDRIIEIEEGKRAVGIKNVTINDNFFQGHFPTRPVMPGVLMVEAMAQTGGAAVLTNPVHHGKLAFFMAVNNVKFRKVVSPGDQLVMEAIVIRDKARIAQVKGVSRVDGEIVAEADMMFSFTDATYLD